MQFARLYLRVVGVLTIFFGLVYLLVPQVMTEPAGFGAIDLSGLTDVRATYGGFQIGLGVFLVWSAARERWVEPALVMTAVTIGAVGTSRLLGATLDGTFNGFHGLGMLTEFSLTALTLFVLSRAHASPDAGTA